MPLIKPMHKGYRLRIWASFDCCLPVGFRCSVQTYRPLPGPFVQPTPTPFIIFSTKYHPDRRTPHSHTRFSCPLSVLPFHPPLHCPRRLHTFFLLCPSSDCVASTSRPPCIQLSPVDRSSTHNQHPKCLVIEELAPSPPPPFRHQAAPYRVDHHASARTNDRPTSAIHPDTIDTDGQRHARTIDRTSLPLALS